MADVIISDRADCAHDYELLRNDCGIIDSSGTAYLALFGEDRKGWLQGQVTNELRSFTPGSAASFCFCDPTGHIVSVCDAWALEDRFVLAVPASTVDAVLEIVASRVVLEDVTVEVMSGEWRAFRIQGPSATTELSQLLQLPTLDAGSGAVGEHPSFALRSNCTGYGGWDILVPAVADSVADEIVRSFPLISLYTTRVSRLEAGIPEFGRDYTSANMPPEMGVAFESKHVSYSKGCYTGQEVLARIKARGHTNRTWVGLVSASPLDEGAAILHLRNKEVGRVTSAVLSPDLGYIGAGFVRNEAAYDGEQVRISNTSGEVEAEIRQMPLIGFE